MPRRTFHLFVVSVAALAVLLTVAPSGAAAPSPIDRLDMAYVEKVTTDLTEIGSTPNGFRVFGTPQDKTTATYLANEMKLLGLSKVTTEKVTGDAWFFEGASAAIIGPGISTTFKASSLGGVPGTGRMPISGQVVHVGYGTAPEYEGLDVVGKVVFAWWDFDNRGIWPNQIAEEAKLHGAKAVIIASGPGHIWYQAGGGDALGSNDAECDLTACVPMITISKNDAGALMSALSRGSVRASVTLKAKNTLNATGYQAIGQITGVGDPSRVIVFTAHHDAWFTSAGDDSVGVAMMMAIAKAVKDSGYRPYYTWVFAPVTGEEYGLANAYADWLQGAWWRMSRSHTEWQHDTVAVLNWEVHSPPYSINAATSEEIVSVVDASLNDSKSGGMIGAYSINPVFSWNDGFVYQAKGAPNVTFGATGVDYWQRYHTDYDNLASLDFPSLAPALQAEAAVALDLDRAAIPYGFDQRLASLGASLDPQIMSAYGADVAGITAAYDRLEAAAEAAADVPYSPCALTATRSAVNIVEDRLTALYLSEGTSYPHQQPQLDIVNLSAAADELRAGRASAALSLLSDVSLGDLALTSSRPAFDRQILVRSPGYPKLSWAVEGQYPLLLDTFDVMHTIQAKSASPSSTYGAEIAELESLETQQAAVYRQRIIQMTAAMNAASVQLLAAAAC